MFTDVGAFFADVQEAAVGRQAQTPIAMPEQEAQLKKFDAELKDALGEQGFEGLDINRPLAAYAAADLGRAAQAVLSRWVGPVLFALLFYDV